MRKSVFILTAIAAITACQSPVEMETVQPDSTPQTVTLTARIDNTKATLGPDDYLYWQDGDRIWINGETYTLSVEGDIATIPEVKIADSYTAVYPADIAGGYNPEDAQNIEVTLPPVQEYKTEDGLPVLNFPIFAYTTTTDLTFANAGALLRFIVNNDSYVSKKIQSITVTPVEPSTPAFVEHFSGVANSFVSADVPFLWAMMITPVTIDGAILSFENESLDGRYGVNDTCYMVIPTLINSKLKVDILATDNEERIYTFSRTTSSAKYLSAGSIGDIPISMNALTENHAAYFPAAAGTEEDPYLISTKDQLIRFKHLVEAADPISSRYFKLDADIDFEGETFYSIGTRQMSFSGTFDGGGHKITNIVLGRKAPDDDPYRNSYCGLFSWGYGATFKNLTLQATATITKSMDYASLFCAGGWNCTFSNITTQGSITITDSGTAHNTGCITAIVLNLDHSTANFINCTNSATVNVKSKKATPVAGGIVGKVENAIKMVGCTNEGDITLTNPSGSADYTCTGGLIGLIIDDRSHTNNVCIIDKCRNTAAVHTYADEDCCAGGIIGRVKDNSSTYDMIIRASNCVNSGAVTSESTDSDDSYAGGVVGWMDSDGPEVSGSQYEPYFYNSLNRGTIRAIGNTSRAGGIGGSVYSGDVTFILCINVGNISAEGFSHTRGAISGGSNNIFHDGGSAYGCQWIWDPEDYIHCIYEWDSNKNYCWNPNPIDSKDLNNLKKDTEIINKEFSTQWTNEQWAGTGEIHACPWEKDYGTYTQGKLNIIFD